MFDPSLPLIGSLGGSPEDSEEEVDDGGRDNAAEPGTVVAAAGAGVLMVLGGFEKEGEGEDAGEQVIIQAWRRRMSKNRSAVRAGAV